MRYATKCSCSSVSLLSSRPIILVVLGPRCHSFVSLLACWLQATFEAELLSQWGRVGVAIPKENALPRTPKSQDALGSEQSEGELPQGAHVACVYSETLCVE